MYGISETLVDQVRNDYSMHLSDKPFELDCSMGSNPYGPAPNLSLPDEVISAIHLYPEDESELTQLINEYFGDNVEITDDMVEYSCGSIGTMLAINRLVLRPGKVVIGVAPTFTAVVDDFVTYEAQWKPVLLKQENNYKFDVNDVLAALEENPGAYIYIDNPNNPTGQIYDIEDLELIVKKAQELGSLVALDEAYGDYMPHNNSGVNLVSQYDNLFVIRTFSKGLGLAGVRLGYAIAQPQLISLLKKTNVPISCNSLAYHLAKQVITSGWSEKTIERVLVEKPRLLSVLETIKVGYTSTSIPISLLYVEDKDVDLAEVFEDVGLRSVSCEGYDGLGKFAVRLNLHEESDKLISLVKKADTSL